MSTEEVNWIPITAKFHSACLECMGDIEEGDQILWLKGRGTKHKVCPEAIQKNHELEVPEDYSKWKDQMIYSYSEVHNIRNCQKCGESLGKDDYLHGRDTGFMAVCEKCI